MSCAHCEQAKAGTAPRHVVSVGWDGANHPMWRFHDELPLRSWERTFPTDAQVMASREYQGFSSHRSVL